MSRVTPFPANPTRRPKSPAPGPTQPLSINRPITRPVTPNSSSLRLSTISNPTRPLRSDLRSRITSQASVQSPDFGSYPPDNTSGNPGLVASLTNASSTFSSSRDSSGGDGPNGFNQFSQPIPRNRFVRPARSAERPISTVRLESDAEPPELSPQQMNALNAFRQAGQRRARRDDERETGRQRERELELGRQKKMKERAMGKRMGKAKAGDVDAILDDVEVEWSSVLDPEFNPVDLALILLDEQQHDEKMEAFQRTKYLLERALKGTMDQNYRAFEAALPHHSFLVNSLNTAQSEVTTVRTSLLEVKQSVGSKRADLVQLWSRGQQVEEMIKLTDQIEYLKSVPDLLESLMSEKRLLPAAALLMNSLKIIGNENMQEIGALADLKSYLFSQETSLREILLEELYAHLFLKTFWCDSRWTPYAPNQQDFPPVPFDEEASFNTGSTHHKPRSNRITKPHAHLNHFLHNLTLRPNEPPYDLTTTDYELKPSTLPGSVSLQSIASLQSDTPESDSFIYLEHVLESLAVLGKLGVSLDAVSQRLPTEIYNLVEVTLSEVGERLESLFRSSLQPLFDGGRPSSVYMSNGLATAANGMSITKGALVLRLTALEQIVKERNREILRDLFWTLYSKLDAVVQGLRVVSEVSKKIASRRSFKESFDEKAGALFPLDKQWLLIQAEIKNLLNDYLVNEESSTSSNRNPLSSINDTLRQLAQRPGSSVRNIDQDRLFRFADSNNKQISKSLKRYEEQLTLALRETVPGLINQGGEASAQAAFSTIGLDDRLTSAGQHRTLLPADAFHVLTLFQPTLSFLNRMVGILPAGVESVQSASIFLDEFILNNYLPQLEEKVSDVYHTAVSGPEAFHEDSTYRELNRQPLVKAAIQIVAMINTLCTMLQMTPSHKDKHSRLILGIIVQFYQQCSDQFRELVTRESMDPSAPPVILGAQWAQNPEMARYLSNLREPTDEKDHTTTNERINQLELSLIGQGTIPAEDILPSMRDLKAMCQLYSSLSWFIEQGILLGPSPTVIKNPSSSDSRESDFFRSSELATEARAEESLRLPLTRESAAHLDAVLKTYRQLADVVLFTIRIDIRCRVIRHLILMLRRANYKLDRDSIEPDPSIIELNDELSKCDEVTSNSLAATEHQFVFEDVGGLIADIFCACSKDIRLVNENGVKKIQRNILALQQSLKTLHARQKDVNLDKAKKFWSMYFTTPQQILMGIRHRKVYTFEEYEAMLKFTCGVEVKTPGEPIADPAYSSHLIKLHELVGSVS